MSNQASSFPAMGNPAPLRRFGGRIPSTSELAIHPLGDAYLVEGLGSVLSLPNWPKGPPVLFHMAGTPTFVNSARLLMPGSINYTFASGESAWAFPLGDGIWRVIEICRLGPGPIGAGVNLNGTNLTYVPPNPNNYRLLTWTGVAFNQGGLFAVQAALGAAFIPPPGSKLIALDAHAWITSGAANPPANWVVKWIKNATVNGSLFLTGGTDVVAGIGAISSTGAGSVTVRSSGYAAVSLGDYFAPFLWCDSTTLGSTTVTIDGNPAHTYATAAVLN